MIAIVLSSDAPHFSQEHLIFGRNYIIELQWIEREHYWVMHIYDGAENPIALGLRLTSHWPIYVDKKLDLAFMLVAKKPNTILSRSSLLDFMLVVHEII